ncbi:energy transducer TonB [Isoalcanivorax beigongshangi]|uniref:Protein TonB n=1 Tax=Isoalcanivorax beigongshangi TaxID=3238810 RepID=A0ABV4AHF4_9GAMM
MTPLAGGPAGVRPRRDGWRWGLAVVLALVLHGAVALTAIWKAPTPTPPPAAAPMVVELAMLAAPQVQPQEEQKPEPLPEPEPEPEPVVEEPPVVEKPEVVLPKPPEKPKPPRPPRPEPPPEPQPEPEPEEPKEEPAPQEQVAANSSDAPAEAEQMQAPTVGVSAAQSADIRQRWEALLTAHVDRFKRYPRQAQMMRMEGVPQVLFTIDRDGNVLDVSISNSSGQRVLDAEALAMIKRAQPLPKPPKEVEGNPIRLSLPIEFSLRNR